MTDKVQKIREEVERLKRWNDNVRNSTRHMTLQEEDFNRGKHSSYLEILNFIDSLQEETVSEDLEKAAEKCAYVPYPTDGNHIDCKKYGSFIEGAIWQEQQMKKDAVDGTVFTQLEDGKIMVRSNYVKKERFEFGDKVKMILIKED